MLLIKFRALYKEAERAARTSGGGAEEGHLLTIPWGAQGYRFCWARQDASYEEVRSSGSTLTPSTPSRRMPIILFFSHERGVQHPDPDNAVSADGAPSPLSRPAAGRWRRSVCGSTIIPSYMNSSCKQLAIGFIFLYASESDAPCRHAHCDAPVGQIP